MMLLGFKARYGGRFGAVPVIQAGGYKLITVKDYDKVPLPLAVLLIQARDVGANFLIIDNDMKRESRNADWVDVRELAA